MRWRWNTKEGSAIYPIRSAFFILKRWSIKYKLPSWFYGQEVNKLCKWWEINEMMRRYRRGEGSCMNSDLVSRKWGQESVQFVQTVSSGTWPRFHVLRSVLSIVSNTCWKSCSECFEDFEHTYWMWKCWFLKTNRKHKYTIISKKPRFTFRI